MSESDIITIDSDYVGEGVAACYLLKTDSGCVLVETSANHAAAKIISVMKEAGYSPEDLQAVILTHIHLDHGGGAGKIMDLCRNAELIVHPRGKRHMADPSRLEKSARMVYGDELFERLYGTLIPVDEKRIRCPDDNAVFGFGGRTFTFLHTPGHAKHHFCIFDEASNGIFTGDSFGLAYGALQKNGTFIMPATTAVDFDPGAARESIRRILDTESDAAYLTHFGALKNLKEAADQLNEDLDFCEELMHKTKAEGFSEEDLSRAEEFCLEGLSTHYRKKAERFGVGNTETERFYLELDWKINAGGIAWSALH